jgi:hypothetical protein
VVAAITLWNTVYLERATAASRQQREIDESLIPHIAPLGWNHINLTGDLCVARQQTRRKGAFPAIARREIYQGAALTYEKIRFLRAPHARSHRSSEEYFSSGGLGLFRRRLNPYRSRDMHQCDTLIGAVEVVPYR